VRRSKEMKCSEAIIYTIIELQASVWEAHHVSILQPFMYCIMWLIVKEDFSAFIFSESFRFVVLSHIFIVN